MAVARVLGLAGFFESFAGILTDGLQQSVAHGSALMLADHQRFVDQRREQVEYGARRNGVAGGHHLGGFEGPSAGERRQAAQHGPLVLRQERVTPVHRRSQRLLPGHGSSRARREQTEPIAQPRGNLLDAKNPHPRRRQLDRQRNTVQAPTDVLDGCGVGWRDREAGQGRLCPVDKQPHRLESQHIVQGRADSNRRRKAQ